LQHSLYLDLIAPKIALALKNTNLYHRAKDKGRQLFRMYPVIHIFRFNIDSYMLFYCIAFIVAAFLLRHELRRNNYPPYLYINLMTVGLITGVIGSKIYYLLGIWNEFILSPFETSFNIAGSGWYGGFALGGISVVLALRLKRLPVLKILDIMIPVVPIGQVFGRLGCFLAGCCHGIPSNVPWALSFPNGLYPAHVKVHPTQLYEMFTYLCIFILLWKLRKKEIKYGVKFGLYLILAGLGRFIVEFYRLNPKILLSLTVPQIAAALGIILGAFVIIDFKPKKY
jgi:phosphatidylglycerol:prolipoprotein diacylglycerol transferase